MDHSEHVKEESSEHKHHGHGTLAIASHATLHCLLGCAIGEVLGVMIGALIGYGVVGRMALGTFFAFVFGLYLAASALSKKQNMTLSQSLKTIFWGEVVSIAAMEIAMNGADYLFGGADAWISDWRFWAGFIIMLPAGYLAALPVNYILIKTAVKDSSHH